MLDKIKEIERLLDIDEYRWDQWCSNRASQILFCDDIYRGKKFYAPLLQKELQICLDTPVTWSELLDVLRSGVSKFNV